MAKWIFTRENGPWSYPTLGFTASAGDIVEADAAIDLWWQATDPAAVPTLPPVPVEPGVDEPGDGFVGVWDRASNSVSFVETVPDANLPVRLGEAELSATLVQFHRFSPRLPFEAVGGFFCGSGPVSYASV